MFLVRASKSHIKTALAEVESSVRTFIAIYSLSVMEVEATLGRDIIRNAKSFPTRFLH